MADGRSNQRPGVDVQRRRILDAAVERFARKGSAAVSIAELCRAAEVSRPTFYRCFADKEAVLAALYEEAVQAPMRLGLAELTAAKRGGRAVFDEVLDALFARPVHLEFLFAESRDRSSAAHRIVQQAHDDAVDAIRAWQKSQGAPVLSRTALRALMVAWQWMAAEHAHRGDEAIDEVRDAAWELARLTFLR